VTSWHQTLTAPSQNVQDYQAADLLFNFNAGSSKKIKIFFACTEFSLFIQKHSLTSVAEYLRHCCTSAHLRFALGIIVMPLISSNATKAMACTVYQGLGNRGGDACVTSNREGITDSVPLHGCSVSWGCPPARCGPSLGIPRH
jgi:hypothetical protein